MKRFLTVFLALVLFAAVLVSCSGEGGNKDVNLKELVGGLVESYSLTGGTLYEKESNPLNEMQIFNLYYKDGSSADFSRVEAYALYLDTSSYAKDTEIGVFRLASGTDKDAFLSFLRARQEGLLTENERYPFDTAALDSAKFGSVGNYVYYVIVRDHNADAETAIRNALK